MSAEAGGMPAFAVLATASVSRASSAAIAAYPAARSWPTTRGRARSFRKRLMRRRPVTLCRPFIYLGIDR